MINGMEHFSFIPPQLSTTQWVLWFFTGFHYGEELANAITAMRVSGYWGDRARACLFGDAFHTALNGSNYWLGSLYCTNSHMKYSNSQFITFGGWHTAPGGTGLTGGWQGIYQSYISAINHQSYGYLSSLHAVSSQIRVHWLDGFIYLWRTANVPFSK